MTGSVSKEDRKSSQNKEEKARTYLPASSLDRLEIIERDAKVLLRNLSWSQLNSISALYEGKGRGRLKEFGGHTSSSSKQCFINQF
jgi:hypothetical protein